MTVAMSDVVIEGRYAAGPLLGRGGMADVYRAHDQTLNRWVALKVFRADASAVADARRFERETRLVAGLHHPNVVQLLDAGYHDGVPYLVLELVEGPTLAQRLAQGPLPSTQARLVGRDLARALSYVHARGVVHRDVKPSNILLAADGRALLCDFGVAQLAAGTQLTTTSATIGTAAYLAPEQMDGSKVTGAADVYALGLVLIEALTGRRPFAGTAQEVALARLARDPDIPPTVPPSWTRLLRAMTSRDPAARPRPEAIADHLDGPSPDGGDELGADPAADELGADELSVTERSLHVVGGAAGAPTPPAIPAATHTLPSPAWFTALVPHLALAIFLAASARHGTGGQSPAGRSGTRSPVWEVHLTPPQVGHPPAPQDTA
jgi:serine/threonine protein kinase